MLVLVRHHGDIQECTMPGKYDIFSLLSQPPKIRSFISGVTSTPLENIEEPLKCFIWEFDKVPL